MTLVAQAIEAFAEEIATLSAAFGKRVVVNEREVASRAGMLELKAPGPWSPNRSCRLVPTADGWIAVNLPRESDRELTPAWVGCSPSAEPWRAILRAARMTPSARMIADARVLGLPVAGLGEVKAQRPDASLRQMAAGRADRPGGPPMVVDLSSMWAGPLCGAILADAGCRVVKVESLGRPDATRSASPEFFRRLNGAKAQDRVDLADPLKVAGLAERMAAADIVITSARPRAFDQLGVTPERLFAQNPGLIWVAITGHGWTGDGADRVAFGDDAAIAGGLVRWTKRGEPRFLGDALADPLTGLAAAVGALRAFERGGGFLIDAALARTAAGVAARRTPTDPGVAGLGRPHPGRLKQKAHDRPR